MKTICPHCGADNPEGAAFCSSCGESLQPIAATGALPEHTLINGRYDVVSVLGRGAMAAVYKAYDLMDEVFVAIKEMSDDALGPERREEAIDQFRREALLLQSLHHPNMVSVRDVFTSGQRHYMVMDFVDGQPLSDVVPLESQAEEEDVRAWALQLCDVLAYLHSRQPPIIFRDLKPENIMFVPDEEDGKGVIKLIDFGIARFFDPQKEKDTLAIGTSGYMAPEAFHGQTDPRSDLYSLGVTLHRLLTGLDPALNPWNLPDVREVAPHVSEEMAQIIAHATELSPEDRFQSAAEFKRALGGEVLVEEEAEEMAVAAPAAARISTERPVWFNGRHRIVSLKQLVSLCDAHWEAAVNHLRTGELEKWLVHLGEDALATYARQLRQTAGADMDVQLETWLESTGLVALPQMEVSPPLQNLGAVAANAATIASFRLRNLGRGHLVAQVQTDAYWLIPEQSWLAGNDQTLNLHVDTRRLPLNQPAEGRVYIQSNGGEAQTTVRVRPTPTGRSTAQARPPTWAASALFLLAVLGGVWLAQQALGRWELSFALDAWQGWAAIPLTALILTLAAMLGSMFQWERLAQDVPLKLWGIDALWTFGMTTAAILLGAGLNSALLPHLPDLSFLLAQKTVQDITPLLMGAVAAMATASGWGAIQRRNASGIALSSILTLVGAMAPWAGAMLGLVLTSQLLESWPSLQKENRWMTFIWLGAGLMTLLVYGIARVAGLLRTPAHATWAIDAMPQSHLDRQIKVKRPRESLAPGYWLAIAGALITIVASFLPWVVVVADGRLLHRWNALVLSGRSMTALSKPDMPPESMPLWILPAIAGLLLLALWLFAWARGRRSWLDSLAPILLGGLALALMLLFYLQDTFTAPLADSQQILRFELGFWIAVAGAILMLSGGIVNLILGLLQE